jgi:hypothetical protein
MDLHDRLYIPNTITNRVRVLDSAGNLICEFGAYGNYDSQGPGGKSPVKTPEIPLGWPTGAGASDGHIYVGDMYNRRVVRVDKIWAAEASCVLGASGSAAIESSDTSDASGPSHRSEKSEKSEARKLSKRSAKQVCTGWFSSARNYKRIGMKKDARRCLNNIIKAYPDSEWAAQAKSELSSL